MNEIKCPNCRTAFQIDESGFAGIIKQVRDEEFEKQLQSRLELAENEKRNAVELAKSEIALVSEQNRSELEKQIAQLKPEKNSAETAKGWRFWRQSDLLNKSIIN